MTPANPNVAPSPPGTGRAARIEEIVARTLARRHAGESLADSQVLAEHADLLPELARSLRTAAEVRRAYLAARRAGLASTGDALDVLSDDELDAPITELIGDRVGNAVPAIQGYEIVSMLPRGGQAVVYLARQTSTGRRVAIKLLTDGRFATVRARRRFDREADVLATLDHPHLVTVIDAGRTKTGDAPYLVMPFVDGRALDDYLAEPPVLGGLGGLDAGPVLELFEKLVRAIHAAHAANVIHRDLKPSNIRVDANGEPRVLDFGLARLLDGPTGVESAARSYATLTRGRQLLGSPPWMSPEQAGGAADTVDGRADIYALGVMLYNALAGRPPYPDDGPAHEILAHAIGTVPIEPSRSPTARRGVNRRIDAVVLKCLAKRAEDRYATASALADDLARCRAGERPVARVEYSANRAGRVNRRVSGLLAVTAATVAVAATVWEGVGLGLLGPGKPVMIPPTKALPPIRSVAIERPPTVYVNPRTGLSVVLVNSIAFIQRVPGTSHLHTVRVPKPFWMGMSEVTRRQFGIIMGRPLHDAEAPEDRLPVTNVSRSDAAEFCRLLGQTDGRHYRLPTEVEWELAARSGSGGPTGGDQFGMQATADGLCWSAANSGGSPHASGETASLPNGLREMNGNVAEWCDNTFDGSLLPGKQPQGVVRGGPSLCPVDRCTNGSREVVPTTLSRPDVGFRVMMELGPETISTGVQKNFRNP